MTFQEREEIFSKEALHISDIQKLFGLKYGTASKYVLDLKNRRVANGRALRLDMCGFIHTADYLEEIGFDHQKLLERYFKKKTYDVYDEIASCDADTRKKIYTY